MEWSKTEVACLFVSRHGSTMLVGTWVKTNPRECGQYMFIPMLQGNQELPTDIQLAHVWPWWRPCQMQSSDQQSAIRVWVVWSAQRLHVKSGKKTKNFSITDVIHSSWTKAQISQGLKVLSAMWHHYCWISKHNRANCPSTQLVQNTPSALWLVGTLWCGSGSGLDHSVSQRLYGQWVAYIGQSFLLCRNQNRWYNLWYSTWTDEL